MPFDRFHAAFCGTSLSGNCGVSKRGKCLQMLAASGRPYRRTTGVGAAHDDVNQSLQRRWGRADEVIE
jgi:hypothetical protein